MPLDALIVSFGFSTNNKIFVTGMLITNALALLLMRSLKTSQEGVYAIGDAAEYEGKIDLIAVEWVKPLSLSTKLSNILIQTVRIVRVHSTSLIEE